VLQRAFEHVGEDFHVAVAVGAKALGRGHAVVIDHQQVREALLLKVTVVAEREGMARMQPAVVGVAALVGFADVEHGDVLSSDSMGFTLRSWRAFGQFSEVFSVRVKKVSRHRRGP